LIEERVSEEEYDKLCEKYRVDNRGRLYCCVVFYTSTQQVPDGINYSRLIMSVEREVKDRVAKKLKCKEFIYIKNTLLIIELDSVDELPQITDICDKFCIWAYDEMRAVVTAGIGRVCDRLYNINNSYEGAIEAVSDTALYGEGRAINIEEKLKEMRKSNSMQLVEKAQDIVAQRYMEADLSLDSVCSTLGVSNSYFSAVFKRETGKPFITYLTDYRLDIAVELIMDTNNKNYKIAEQVGYLDANYFSYVFKRRFGVSPSKYKKEVLAI
jgi:AraC-like DNA-binding protein